MTDHELLELTAKAAGIETKRMWHPSLNMGQGAFMSPEGYPWNPLTDDGDALRLAVKLKIEVWHGKWPSGVRYVSAQRIWDANDSIYYDDGVELGDDPYAATRRAIVRAAAEIGKEMK